MKRLLDCSQNVPILSWAGSIDGLSSARLQRLARWARLAGPIAVMPDIHFAGDVCVGTVLATSDCILPTAVGQDLGCGMRTARFEISASDFRRADFECLIERIAQRVPCGRRTHGHAQALPAQLLEMPLSAPVLAHARDFIGARHFGTLGEGNHFIELQRGPDDALYAAVHSGSRGIGAAIARHHAAVALRASAGEILPLLELESAEARQFVGDLQWALVFAEENRRRMMEEVHRALEDRTGSVVGVEHLFDVAHNLISFEEFRDAGGPGEIEESARSLAVAARNVGARRLVIHRKGAMPAGLGERGIIPGSMGTASYLVEGLGCAEAYSSCSHGAGRKLSRGDAHRRISIGELRRQMKDVVYPRGMERALVEEAPGAYKDIRGVLERQRELVRPVARLVPLAVVKG